MPISRLAARALAGGLLVFTAGCADPPGRTEVPAAVAADNPPPVIDTAQLAYDPTRRTVHFYELIADPNTGRKATWQVWLPDGTTAYPSGKTFQVRRDVNETEVVIKACDPPGPTSVGVKLSDVPRKKKQ